MLLGESEVGWYGAATTIVFTLAMVPQGYRLAIYPLMAHYAEDRQKLVRLYESSLRYLGTLVLPMIAGIELLAPSIIELVFSSDFVPSITILRTLAPVLFFIFLNVPNVRMMFVHNRQSWVTGMLLGSMTINIILNLGLIPKLGPLGSAWARVCSSLVFFTTNILVLRWGEAKLITGLFRILWRPALATLLMTGILVFLDWPLLFIILVGMMVYFGILLTIEGIPDEDWCLIKELVPFILQG